MTDSADGRCAKVAFWTLTAITLLATGYGLLLEGWGIGKFISNNPVPKLHMRIEAQLARAVSLYAAVPLAVISAVVAFRSRLLCVVGVAAIAFCLFYHGLPRF
jgi:hypothetical protein